MEQGWGMKERPIIFSGSMVNAILEGRKTQTRRVIRRTESGRVKERGTCRNWHLDDTGAYAACPYGLPGDRLWVRETWGYGCGVHGHPPECDSRCVIYRASGGDTGPDDGKWRPSIHMPRWASRIDLEITVVRVQRVQDISDADARAEGVVPWDDLAGKGVTVGQRLFSHRLAFRHIWDKINGPGSWESNPSVWAIAFKRAE